MQTGGMIQRLRRTLTGAGHRIGDVLARHGEALGEPERWRDLAEVERLFLDALAARGKSDPLLNRLASADAPRLPDTVARIVLAATPDLDGLTLRALERLAPRVTLDILIAAPTEEAHRFDAWGRPLPEAWNDAAIDIPDPDRAIALAGTPADQAQRAARELLEWPGTDGPGGIAVGVPDRAVVPFLAAALEDAGLAVHDPADRSVRDSALYGLLRAYGAFMVERRYDSLSALLRHPDILSALEADRRVSPTALLRELDEFQNRHLPLDFSDLTRRLPARRAAPSEEAPVDAPALNAALSFLLEHVDTFERDDLASAVRGFLRAVYESRVLAGDSDAFERVARHVDNALHEIADAETQAALTDAPTAVALFLEHLGELSTPSERAAEDGVELEGWFELPWNGAPCLIVTGMNEGSVPSAGPADPFLPDSLCRAIGCPSDADRLARDAWILRALIESRRAAGCVRLIAGKVGAAGDVLLPSRLLLRTPDTELPDRAARLFGPVPARGAAPAAAASFRLDPRPPPDVAPAALDPRRLSVTAFRDYLACPFRFYLKHVLGMEALDDAKREPDALDFGNLIHDALRDMALDPAQNESDNPEALGAFLAARAADWVGERFGAIPSLAVSVALDAAVQRLRAAARVQAELRRTGWRIRQAEHRLEVEFEGVTVVGRIDRVDLHPETGRVRVIDYKTSDTPVLPAKAHLAACRADTPDAWRLLQEKRAGRWIDLQLPLYLILLSDSLGDNVETAYFNLPKAVTDTGVAPWNGLDASVRASAETCARDVIRRIRERAYWPPADRVDRDDFASLFFAGTESFQPLRLA
jgi:ATP-dependent helicase/nuclease subunit B